MEKEITIKEAAERWVEQMNAYPLGMIEKLHSFEPEEWREITPPSVDDCVYCYETQSEGTIIKVHDDETYEVEMNDGKVITVTTNDFEVERYTTFPAWGTMWAFDNGFDNDWLADNLQAMADCGFRIYESDEFGYFFGIDGGGYNFYEYHWIPLYKARGLHWHTEE